MKSNSSFSTYTPSTSSTSSTSSTTTPPFPSRVSFTITPEGDVYRMTQSLNSETLSLMQMPSLDLEELTQTINRDERLIMVKVSKAIYTTLSEWKSDGGYSFPVSERDSYKREMIQKALALALSSGLHYYQYNMELMQGIANAAIQLATSKFFDQGGALKFQFNFNFTAWNYSVFYALLHGRVVENETIKAIFKLNNVDVNQLDKGFTVPLSNKSQELNTKVFEGNSIPFKVKIEVNSATVNSLENTEKDNQEDIEETLLYGDENLSTEGDENLSTEEVVTEEISEEVSEDHTQEEVTQEDSELEEIAM